MLNCSLVTSLSGWQASSDTGHVELTRVTTPPSPAGETTGAEVVASSPTGNWAMVLIALRQPGDYFQVGSTYRMQLWVRDVAASGANLILALDLWEHAFVSFACDGISRPSELRSVGRLQ